MRLLAISDIHGRDDKLNKLLKKVNYDKSRDQLILLGDYVDRGQESKQVLDRVINLVKDGAIALRGNHDGLFLNWLLREEYDYELDQHYMNNGGFMTLLSYVGPNWFESGIDVLSMENAKKFIIKNYSHHIKFLKDLPYYYETDKHIFIHAGINPEYGDDWKSTPEYQMIWIREEFYKEKTGLDKVVVFGHTPCINLHDSSNIYFTEDKIGIDGGYKYQLNCLEITENETCLREFYV